MKQRRRFTYQQIGCFEGRTVHVVDAIFLENSRKAVYETMLVYGERKSMSTTKFPGGVDIPSPKLRKSI